LDFFIINTFVEFTSGFSKWFWLGYATVPAYVLWHIGKWIIGYFSNINYQENEGDKDGKKKAKKDK